MKRGNRKVSGLHRGGRQQHLLFRGERPVYISPIAGRRGMKEWLRRHVLTEVTVVNDAQGQWFELEVTLPGNFSGSPAEGWTNGTATLGLFYSTDLQSWSEGGWVAAPGKPPQTLADGRIKWSARYLLTPAYWEEVMVDEEIESSRAGKAITELELFPTPILLPGFPYAMPADAARLQADLRAAGYPGATVTSTAKAQRVEIRNHLPDGTRGLPNVSSSGSVTAVKDAYTSGFPTIALPGYPYAVFNPAGKAALQADLRAAGFVGAVVKIFDDTWRVFVPDRLTSGLNRSFRLTISPPDPFPAFDLFGNSLGDQPDSSVSGSSFNVRTPLGNPLSEAKRAFARVGFIDIPDRP